VDVELWSVPFGRRPSHASNKEITTMEMTGEYRIPASRDAVWQALNDPDVLKQCIPGCDEIEKSSDTEFSAKVTAKVGPVKAKFSGAVTLSDIDPPNGYTISGEGTGGAAGFAKGGAKVALADDGNETILTYDVNATVGGKLAQIGSRLIDSTSKKMANEFFSKFAEVVGEQWAKDAAAEEPNVETAATAIPAAPTAPAPADRPDMSEKKGLPPMVWVGGVIVLVLIALWAFQQ
jgi:uncharacterized protein